MSENFQERLLTDLMEVSVKALNQCEDASPKSQMVLAYVKTLSGYVHYERGQFEKSLSDFGVSISIRELHDQEGRYLAGSLYNYSIAALSVPGYDIQDSYETLLRGRKICEEKFRSVSEWRSTKILLLDGLSTQAAMMQNGEQTLRWLQELFDTSRAQGTRDSCIR